MMIYGRLYDEIGYNEVNEMMKYIFVDHPVKAFNVINQDLPKQPTKINTMNQRKKINTCIQL